MTKIDKALETELEAAAFRRLVEHLRERHDVQNIDLMNMAGFCRNCLANWYQEAASEQRARAQQGRRARGDLRHALQGVAGQAPKGGERRAEGGLRQEQAARLKALPAARTQGCVSFDLDGQPHRGMNAAKGLKSTRDGKANAHRFAWLLGSGIEVESRIEDAHIVRARVVVEHG